MAGGRLKQRPHSPSLVCPKQVHVFMSVRLKAIEASFLIELMFNTNDVMIWTRLEEFLLQFGRGLFLIVYLINFTR